MIKLFVSDMDGTLLNDQHIVSRENAQAVKDLQNHGIQFLIATGRTYETAAPLLLTHGIKVPIIALNGAASYDINGQLTTAIPIQMDYLEQITQFAQAHGLNYSIATADRHYVNDLEDFHQRMTAFLKHLMDQIDHHGSQHERDLIERFLAAKSVDDYQFHPNNQPLKLMIYGASKDALAKVRDTFEGISDMDITSSGPDNLEITHRQAQKGNAIRDYISQKDISFDNVVTIGDSLNDRSMLEATPHSYVMANASDEIKAYAQHIAPNHRDHGVAQVIHSIIKQQSQS